MAMNSRYSATLFILQTRMHTDTHVYKCVSKYIAKTTSVIFYKVTIKKSINTGVNYNQLFTYSKQHNAVFYVICVCIMSHHPPELSHTSVY